MRRVKSAVEILASMTLQNCMVIEPDMKVFGDIRAIDLARMSFAILKHCPMCESEGFKSAFCQLCRLARNVRELETLVQEDSVANEAITSQGAEQKSEEIIDINYP
jgi:hypothetical protein